MSYSHDVQTSRMYRAWCGCETFVTQQLHRYAYRLPFSKSLATFTRGAFLVTEVTVRFKYDWTNFKKRRRYKLFCAFCAHCFYLARDVRIFQISQYASIWKIFQFLCISLHEANHERLRASGIARTPEYWQSQTRRDMRSIMTIRRWNFHDKLN